MITANGSDAASVVSAAGLPKLPVLADTKGRLRVSKAQRRDILAALARSHESLPQFARRTGLKYSTVARWVQNGRRSQLGGRSRQVPLLEAVVEAAPRAAAETLLLLQLPGGVRLEVGNEKQAALAAALVRALEQPC